MGSNPISSLKAEEENIYNINYNNLVFRQIINSSSNLITAITTLKIIPIPVMLPFLMAVSKYPNIAYPGDITRNNNTKVRIYFTTWNLLCILVIGLER